MRKLNYKIAVEGLENDIVPLVCDILEAYIHRLLYFRQDKIGWIYHKVPNSVKKIMGRTMKILHPWYTIRYKHESPFSMVDSSVIDDIVASKPDLTITCNAGGYLDFLKHYSKRIDIPILVLTGGGPDLQAKVKKYTPYVLSVPFNPVEVLYDKVNEMVENSKN